MRKESRYLFNISLVFLGIVLGVILTSRFELPVTGYAEKEHSLSDANISFDASDSAAQQIQSANDLSKVFIEINRKVTPSIVSITAIRKMSKTELRSYHQKNNQDFWDLFNDPTHPFNLPEEYQQGTSGSGIIVQQKGYILTNTHVVNDAFQLKVTLFDNRSYNAQIIGIDSLTEVAVIKVNADNLPAAKLGNSDDLEVGQWVLAIGNPMELRFTVTAGIISAIGRQMQIIRDNFGIENFIQTDAVINPGNSGGALVNLHGEVIGINTAIATRSGYYEGYGFAIPINLAKTIMLDLISKGRVVRAYMGVAMLPMDNNKAKAYGLTKPEGVFIDNVLPDGPAMQAGIQDEDIIAAINNISVDRPNQVQSLIAQQNPGAKVLVTILRHGKRIVLPIILEEREQPHPQLSQQVHEKIESNEIGLKVKSLNSREARALNLQQTSGVLVTEIKAFSSAFDAGLKMGDVILRINDTMIDGEADFKQEIKKQQKGDVVRLLIQRNMNQTHIFLEIP